MNPFQAAPDGKKRLTLIGIYLAVITVVFVSSGATTLLPAAAAEIGGTEYYSLANTLMGTIGVCAMPLFGFLGARNPASKRKLAAGSLAVGGLVLLSRALAPSMSMIIIPSLFYGPVTAGVYVIGYSMIRDMYDAKQAGVFLGAIGTMMSVGLLVGPTATGLLIDNFGWRVANHVTWPLMLLAAALIFFGVKVSTEDAKGMAAPVQKFDTAGAVTLMLFLMSLILALSLGGSFAPFGGLYSNLMFAVAVVALIALIFAIRKKGNAAIIPVPVLKDQNTLCLSIANLLLNFSTMAVFFFMPMYVMYVIGGTATQASLTTTLTSVIGLVLSPILGRMIGKAGNARGVLIFGTIIRILITACLLLFLSPTTPLPLIYVLMFVAGIYSSQQGVTFSAAPQIQIKPEIRMLSNSVIQVMQNFGASVGIAVYTLVIGTFGVAQGMNVALILALATAVLALFVSLPLKNLNEPAVAKQEA